MFLAIGLIPLLLVSTITFTNYKNSLETSRLSQLRDLVTFKTEGVEAYFAGLKADTLFNYLKAGTSEMGSRFYLISIGNQDIDYFVLTEQSRFRCRNNHIQSSNGISVHLMFQLHE